MRDCMDTNIATNIIRYAAHLQVKGEETLIMNFSQLRVGDFFEAYGTLFLKLPKVTAVDLPDANAVDTTTGRLACFGATVPVEFAGGSDVVVLNTTVRRTKTDKAAPDTKRTVATKNLL